MKNTNKNTTTKAKKTIITTVTALLMAGMIGTAVMFCGCAANQNTPAETTAAATQAATQAQTVAPVVTEAPPQTVAPTTAAPAQNNDNGEITLDKAVDIALKDAGFTAADVNFTKKVLDTDDGVRKYEVEFTNGGYEYEYDINAANGQIIEKSKDVIGD